MQAPKMGRVDKVAARQVARMAREAARQEAVFLRSHDGGEGCLEKEILLCNYQMIEKTSSCLCYSFGYCYSSLFWLVVMAGLKWMLAHIMHVFMYSYFFHICNESASS